MTEHEHVKVSLSEVHAALDSLDYIYLTGLRELVQRELNASSDDDAGRLFEIAQLVMKAAVEKAKPKPIRALGLKVEQIDRDGNIVA